MVCCVKRPASHESDPDSVACASWDRLQAPCHRGWVMMDGRVTIYRAELRMFRNLKWKRKMLGNHLEWMSPVDVQLRGRKICTKKSAGRTLFKRSFYYPQAADQISFLSVVRLRSLTTFWLVLWYRTVVQTKMEMAFLFNLIHTKATQKKTAYMLVACLS